MKATGNILRLVALAMGVLAGLPASVAAQAFLNQVRLTEPITTVAQQAISLTVADSVTAGDVVYVDREAMVAQAVNTTTDVVTVSRGQLGTAASPHGDDTIVWTGVANRFYYYSPSGRCTAPSAYPGGAKPWINILTGAIAYCDDNLFGVNQPSFWRGPAADGMGRLSYTPIAYRTSRTSVATVIPPALTIYLWDHVIASLTYTGPFELFLPDPTGLLGKEFFIRDAAGLNTNAATSAANRTMTIRGLFADGDNTKTLAKWQQFEEQPGATTEQLVGAFATTRVYVGITATSMYYWFTGW